MKALSEQSSIREIRITIYLTSIHIVTRTNIGIGDNGKGDTDRHYIGFLIRKQLLSERRYRSPSHKEDLISGCGKV